MVASNTEQNLIIEKCFEAGNLEQALQFAKALSKNNPHDPYGPFWLGRALYDQGRYDHAAISFRKALELDDKHYPSIVMLAAICYRQAKWDEIEPLKVMLASIKEGSCKEEDLGLVDPFITLLMGMDDSIQFKITKSRANYLKKTRPERKWMDYAVHSDKLHIGYLSLNYGNEGIGMLTRDMFGLHNKEKYKVFVYSLRKVEDEYLGCLQSNSDVFRDFSGKTDFEIGHTIHSDEVDILVDLCGYSEGARPRVMAMRPAPVSCHMLGYPGSMASSFVRNHITTEGVTPHELDSRYTEDIYYLAKTPLATAPLPMPENSLKREDYGLSPDYFVYCYLGDASKINKETFDAWMKILSETEQSVLWLLGGESVLEENLKGQADFRGIDSARIIFAANEHLSQSWRHQLADLWLEPLNCADGQSTIMALWAGLPVLAFEGKSAHERVSAELLLTNGMPECVTDSVETYVERAIDIYDSRDEQENLKEKILNSRHESAIFNPEDYIENLEQIYQEMWNNFLGAR